MAASGTCLRHSAKVRRAGNRPLAGATMLKSGVHDVDPSTGAHANGYLVFTTANGDIAYLKYQFRAVPVPGPDGKPRFEANGFWETAAATEGPARRRHGAHQCPITEGAAVDSGWRPGVNRLKNFARELGWRDRTACAQRAIDGSKYRLIEPGAPTSANPVAFGGVTAEARHRLPELRDRPRNLRRSLEIS